MVMDQEEMYFRVWMFQGAKLYQFVPEHREDDISAPSHLSDIHTRFALSTDGELLREMLIASAGRTQTPNPDNGAAICDAGHARFLEGWPRNGDLGLIAMATWEINRWEPIPVGAVCLGQIPDDEADFRLLPAGVPELIIAVGATQRGRGIGTVLIRRLLQMAAHQGIQQVSTRVQRDSPAVRFFEREGFHIGASGLGNRWLVLTTYL